MKPIDFQTDPSRYRHWRIEIDGEVASLIMDVDASASLFEGVELKLNSYELGVLPGTGGLTRVTDKRKVRRDRADVFCSTEEGLRGVKAVEWRLVDEVVPNSKWDEAVNKKARALAARSDRPRDAKGIALTPL